jgi:hypothetical protein
VDGRDHAERHVLRIEDGPLLDVNFHECSNVRCVQQGLLCLDRRHVGAGVRQILAQAPSGIHASLGKVFRCEQPEQCPRADPGPPEPGALLAAQHQELDRAWWNDVLARQRAEHEDPCDDARGSVVVATARNAVEVRTRRNERLRFVSLKRYAKVPCAIARDVETRC